MTRAFHWLAAAITALFLLGCTSGAQVKVDYDTKINFQPLKSYAWAPITEQEKQEKARNSITHERIAAAIDAHLAARGFTKAEPAQADFLVTHTVIVESRTQVHETSMTVGYGRYGTHGGVGIGYGIPVNTTVYQYKVGTLVIDIIDNRQQKLIWRGSGERTLSEDRTPEERIEIIDTTVNEILANFPPPVTSKP